MKYKEFDGMIEELLEQKLAEIEEKEDLKSDKARSNKL